MNTTLNTVSENCIVVIDVGPSHNIVLSLDIEMKDTNSCKRNYLKVNPLFHYHLFIINVMFTIYNTLDFKLFILN